MDSRSDKMPGSLARFADYASLAPFLATPPQPAPIQTVKNTEPIMEQMLVRMPAGAVAYIGVVTGGQRMEITLNLTFYSAIAKGSPTVGEAWNTAIREFYSRRHFEPAYDNIDWSVLADFHQPWKFMLFGDPSLRIGGIS
jgi:hypothetical protein